MKIATWNVNSMRVRLPHVLDWLKAQAPDVLAIQELKQPDQDFPLEAIEAAGYEAVWSGQKTYNGVALLTRKPATDVIKAFPDFADEQKRVLGATVDGVRILNLYVPNGESVESDKYTYKLNWLDRLYDHLKDELSQHDKVIVLGDFNIAPADNDVYDPAAWRDKVLCSAPERDALEKILALGFVDVFRLFEQPEAAYSWWNYRTFAFQGNRGLRIDLILSSQALEPSAQSCWVDVAPRGWERPSDHAPVLAEFS